MGQYLYKKAQEGAVYFNEDKIKTYTVESFVKYLEENLSRVKEKAPTTSAAFSLALNIENSLLIKRSYERFQSADRELANLLLSLRAKKADHRKRLEVRSAPHSPTRPAP